MNDSSTPVATPALAIAPEREQSVSAWQCEGCQLISHLYAGPSGPAAVDALAGTHNDLHHGGWSVARRIELEAVCESCGHAPAAVGLDLGPGVAPFAVCTSCAPADATAGLGTVVGGTAARS